MSEFGANEDIARKKPEGMPKHGPRIFSCRLIHLSMASFFQTAVIIGAPRTDNLFCLGYKIGAGSEVGKLEGGRES
jgi:hypothetical protein